MLGERYPWEDSWPFVQALLEAFTPDRCMWGSDWPFLRAPERIDYGLILALIERLVPDPGDRRKVLWETPLRLFGFDESLTGAGSLGGAARPRRFPNDELGGNHDRGLRPAQDPTQYQVDERPAGMLDVAMEGRQRRLAKVGPEDIVMAHDADRAWHDHISPT